MLYLCAKEILGQKICPLLKHSERSGSQPTSSSLVPPFSAAPYSLKENENYLDLKWVRIKGPSQHSSDLQFGACSTFKEDCPWLNIEDADSVWAFPAFRKNDVGSPPWSIV